MHEIYDALNGILAAAGVSHLVDSLGEGLVLGASLLIAAWFLMHLVFDD